MLNVDELSNVKTTIKTVRSHIDENFLHVAARVMRMFLGPSDSSKLEVQIKGPDADVLYQKVQEIMNVFHKLSNMIDIRTDWEQRIKKIIVKINQQNARRAGVSSLNIAESLESYFNGLPITELR